MEVRYQQSLKKTSPSKLKVEEDPYQIEGKQEESDEDTKLELDPFGFDSDQEHIFVQNEGIEIQGTSQLMEAQKQMFTEVCITLFIPKDPKIVNQNFNIIDAIDDQFESLIRLDYLCEIVFCTVESIILRSLEDFNIQLEQSGCPLRFITNIEYYHLRMAKKKNGKPNFDFPKLSLQQNIATVDFTHFCVVYQSNGVVNMLMQSAQLQALPSANKKKSTKQGIQAQQKKNGSYDQLTISKHQPQEQLQSSMTGSKTSVLTMASSGVQSNHDGETLQTAEECNQYQLRAQKMHQNQSHGCCAAGTSCLIF